MTAVVRRLLPVILGYVWLHVPMAEAQPAGPAVRALQGDLLRRGGAARLEELLSWTEAWPAATVEGLHTSVGANGLGIGQGPPWVLVVDGLVLTMGLFGEPDLAALPLAIADVDSVEVTGAPGLHDGRYTGHGMLRVHTTRPGPGLRVGGSVWAGNGIDDPGPYQYVRQDLHNSERIGPDAVAFAGYGGRRGSLRASVYRRVHGVASAGVRRRIGSIFATTATPGILMTGGRLRGEVERAGGRHELQAGLSRLDDLYFLQPLGHEVPTVRHHGYAGAHGAVPLTPRLGLRYRAQYEAVSTAPRPTRLPSDLAWRRSTAHASAELHYEAHGASGMLGGHVERGRARDAGPIAASRRLYAAFAEGELPLTRRVTQRLGVYGTTADGGVGLKAWGRTTWRTLRHGTFSLLVAREHRLRAEDRGIESWYALGLRPLEPLGASMHVPAHAAAVFSSVHVSWQVSLAGTYRVALAPFLRHVRGLHLFDQALRLDRTTFGVTSPGAMRADAEGTVHGLQAVLHVDRGGRLSQRFGLVYERAAGSEAFLVEARRRPRLRLSHYVDFRPNDRFSLVALLRYGSRSRWSDYAGAEAATEGLYRAVLPARWLLDLTAHKRLWGERMEGSLTVRNAFNQATRHHPLGATFPMSLTARLALEL